jgi:hypothetical protein
MSSEIFGRKDAVGLSERIVWATPEPLQLGYRTVQTWPPRESGAAMNSS